MIRLAVPEDARAIARLEAALVADGRGEVRGPDDLRSEAEIAERLPRVPRWVVVDGGIVGSGSVHVLPPARCRHVASLALGIHPDHQGKGWGRRLVGHLVEVARRQAVVRLELYVRADNHRAIGLYRQFGFVRESVRRRFVRLDDGTFIDDWCMVRFLDTGVGDVQSW